MLCTRGESGATTYHTVGRVEVDRDDAILLALAEHLLDELEVVFGHDGGWCDVVDGVLWYGMCLDEVLVEGCGGVGARCWLCVERKRKSHERKSGGFLCLRTPVRRN